MTETDWRKCFLCQTDTKDELICPPSRYECSSDSYFTIATNIPLFRAINLLPIRLDEGGGIEETLRRNHAKYHRKCRQMFDNSKHERARERAAEIQNDPV